MIQGQFEIMTLLLLLIFSSSTFANHVMNLEEFKKLNSDLTEAIDLLLSSPRLSSDLKYKPGTFFAPTNAALEEYEKLHPHGFTNDTLLYHFSNSPTAYSDFDESSLSTELPGNLPIWVTKWKGDIYLNGAKIIRHDKRVKLGDDKLEQIVHAINKVLQPTIPNSPTKFNLSNPDAKKYLEYSQEYGISASYSTLTFFGRVQKLNRLDLFQSPGRHTFFLPVNEAFQSTRIDSVDNKAIDGHMIVGKAIFLGIDEVNSFTGSSPILTFETSAAAGNFPVQVTIEYSKTTKSYSVLSENLVKDETHKHRTGKVRAEVLKSNIPVKNGVVHLISRPLVVIDSDVYKLMQADTFLGDEKGEGENAPLRKFFELIDGFPDIKEALSDATKRVTVFAPTSAVIERSENFQELLKRTGPEAREELEEILKLHVVQQDITSEDIYNASNNKTHPYSVRPLAAHRELYFTLVGGTGDRGNIAVVDGGGTSATIKQADIGATNGVIHLVNRVLGIGDNTIYDRLKTDPYLTSTYTVSLQENFNEMFKKKGLKLTFFAPNNLAWDGLKYESHSKHKIVFDGHHSRHSERILRRHVIAGAEKSLEDLYRQSITANKTIEVGNITTFGGTIRVISKEDPNFDIFIKKYGAAHPRSNATRFHGDYKYVIFWKNKEVRVVHGNIKCANGYLHIIDTVMMTPDDVFVNSAMDILNSSLLNYILMILLSLLLL